MENNLLGDYKLIRKLGKGPIGTVYEAEDTRTNSKCALKIIDPEFYGIPLMKIVECYDNFKEKGFEHPHLLNISDRQQIGSTVFLEMEFLPSGNLDEWITRVPRPVTRKEITQIVDIAIQIAEGLKYLHQNGLTHLNLKPTNVLFNARGQIKLSGMGEGRVYTSSESTTTSTSRVWVHEYMSPEQSTFTSAPTTASDVYSLGVILYKMLTGSLPKLEENASSLDLHGLPTLPKELLRALQTLLNQNPKDRPPDGKSALGELNNVKTALFNTTTTGDFPSVFKPHDQLNSHQHQYEVLGLVGFGGAGEVYKARRLDGDPLDCAIKVIEVKSPSYDRHFDFEVDLLKKYPHPGLPQVLDTVTTKNENGIVYRCMVMDYLGAGNLATYCTNLNKQGNNTRIAQVLNWAGQLCDIVEFLHSRTPPVIHRDIKPQNIMRAESNRLVLVDFGIAKEFTDSRTTTTAALMISQGYSPPEQYDRDRRTTERSDIYSLGASLYFILTGEEPPTPYAIMQKQMQSGQNATPEVRSKRPDIPANMNDAIYTAMQADDQSRFANIAEFRKALNNKNYRARRPSRVVMPATPMMAVVGLFLLAMLAIGFFVLRSLEPGNATSFTATETAISLNLTENAIKAGRENAQNEETAQALQTMERNIRLQQTWAAQTEESAYWKTETAIAAITERARDVLRTPSMVVVIPITPTHTVTPSPTHTATNVVPPTYTPTQTPIPPRPDLIISDGAELFNYTYNGGCAIRDSQTKSTILTIINRGDANSGPFIVRVNYSDFPVGGLGAGQSLSVDITSAVYQGSATIDVANQVAESNENNNFFNQPLVVPTAPIFCSRPAAPQPVYPGNNTWVASGTITFSWNPVADATAYQVLYYSPGHTSGSDWISGTSWSGNLPPGTYTWWVTARNSTGQGPESTMMTLNIVEAEITVVPRLPGFTWDGNSRHGIAAQNTVYCSANPDFSQSIYYRTDDPTAWARWTPDIRAAGNYRIFVYIPDYTHTAPITSEASYELYTPSGGLRRIAVLDQNSNKCTWVDIGTYYLDAGSANYVHMPGKTNEPSFRLIASDGMRFVWVP